MSDDHEGPSSTKPYLLRALYEWCTDNGLTPYLAVQVDSTVRVPREHVKDGEIVLNIGFSATRDLLLGNDAVSFKARFGGVARDILVPISHVTAIYARENGQGMAFPPPLPEDAVAGMPVDVEPAAQDSAAPAQPHLHAVPDVAGVEGVPADEPEPPPPPPPPPRSGGGHLKRVK